MLSGVFKEVEKSTAPEVERAAIVHRSGTGPSPTSRQRSTGVTGTWGCWGDSWATERSGRALTSSPGERPGRGPSSRKAPRTSSSGPHWRPLHGAVGRSSQQTGRLTEATEAFRKAIVTQDAIPNPEPVDLYDLACWHALLGGLGGRPGSGVSEAEGRDERDLAMSWLERAIAAGYPDATHMQTDTDLDPLRGREDFRLLMFDLAFPADPFSLPQ